MSVVGAFLLKLFPYLLNRLVGLTEYSFLCVSCLSLLSACLVLLSLPVRFLPAWVTLAQVRFSTLPVSLAIFFTFTGAIGLYLRLLYFLSLVDVKLYLLLLNLT